MIYPIKLSKYERLWNVRRANTTDYYESSFFAVQNDLKSNTILQRTYSVCDLECWQQQDALKAYEKLLSKVINF